MRNYFKINLFLIFTLSCFHSISQNGIFGVSCGAGINYFNWDSSDDFTGHNNNTTANFKPISLQPAITIGLKNFNYSDPRFFRFLNELNINTSFFKSENINFIAYEIPTFLTPEPIQGKLTHSSYSISYGTGREIPVSFDFIKLYGVIGIYHRNSRYKIKSESITNPYFINFGNGFFNSENYLYPNSTLIFNKSEFDFMVKLGMLYELEKINLNAELAYYIDNGINHLKSPNTNVFNLNLSIFIPIIKY